SYVGQHVVPHSSRRYLSFHPEDRPLRREIPVCRFSDRLIEASGSQGTSVKRFQIGVQNMSSSNDELFQSARSELFSAVIGDVMDKLGFQHQFLPPAIVPLERNMVV